MKIAREGGVTAVAVNNVDIGHRVPVGLTSLPLGAVEQHLTKPHRPLVGTAGGTVGRQRQLKTVVVVGDGLLEFDDAVVERVKVAGSQLS